MDKVIGNRYYNEPGQVYHWGAGTCPHCATRVAVKVTLEEAKENIKLFSRNSYLDPEQIFPTTTKELSTQPAEPTVDKKPEMPYNVTVIENLTVSFVKE